MEIRARYILIGLFTLAVILGGFAFVYWLETTGGLGKRTNYRVRFQNTVSGLLSGSPVLFNGIRVGEVTGLNLVPSRPREVEATIAVDARAPIRSDTQVSLEFQGLTGVPVVTLAGGSADAPLVAGAPGEAPMLLASEAAGRTMTEEARQVLTRIDTILAANADDLRKAMSSISAFSEALGRNSGKVDGILAGLERMTGGGKTSGVFYTLTAVPPASEPQTLGKQLTIPDPTALIAFDSEKILTQQASGEFAALGNGKWADTLTKLIQAKLIQSFENNTSPGEVSRMIEGATPDYQLAIDIRHFDIAPAPEALARAEISAKLIGTDGKIVAAKVFSETTPVKSQEEAEAAQALDTAFGRIAANLIAWTKSTIASQEEPHPAAQKLGEVKKKKS